MYIHRLHKKGIEELNLEASAGEIVFSRVNLIVGGNNSGKSRLIRALFKNCSMDDSEKKRRKKEILRRVTLFHNNMQDEFSGGVTSRLSHTLGIHKQMALLLPFAEKEITTLSDARVLKDCIEEIQATCEREKNRYISSSRFSEFSKEVSQIGSELRDFELLFIGSCYIPVPRLVKPLFDEIRKNENGKEIKTWKYEDALGDRIFYEYFKKEDNSNAHLRERIFTGLKLYNMIHDYKNAPATSRDRIKKYEDFLNENFFASTKVEINVDKETGSVLFMLDSETNEHEIFNWGESVQSIVSITLQPFLMKDERMVFFIEEPENHLHPSMQRRLLEVLLASDFEKHQFFFTTHSNHLLDLSFDYNQLSVFLTKRQEGLVRIEQTKKNEYSPYEELGVRNSSVLAANCTIWVEGITDVIYFRKYLNKLLISQTEFADKYKEDLHFAFVIYGGSCIQHWKLAEGMIPEGIDYKALSRKVFVITDNPGTSKAKIKRHSNLIAAFQDNFHEISVREVENLLPLKALNEFLHAKNSMIPKIISIQKYEKKKLGEVLSKLGAEHPALDEYMNIVSKLGFAREMLPYIESVSFEELHPEAQEISRKLLQFIESNNK